MDNINVSLKKKKKRGKVNGETDTEKNRANITEIDWRNME